MLNQLNILTENIGGMNKLADFWLSRRRQLLIVYYRLIGAKPSRGAVIVIDEKSLDDFCQNLVDYLSAGHFSIYERIIHNISDTSPVRAAISIYPSLQENTTQIMHLYDSHLESAIDHNSYAQLQRALSEIGEMLEERFILEDKLIHLACDNALAESAATGDESIDNHA